MLVRDLRNGRLLMLPDSQAMRPRSNYQGLGGVARLGAYEPQFAQVVYDRQLGLPFLAALAPLAAKVLAFLPAIAGKAASVLPMISNAASALPALTGGDGAAAPPPQPGPPVTATAVPSEPAAPAQSAPTAPSAPLPLPPAQSLAPPAPLPAAPPDVAPITTKTTATDTETVVAPLRVMQPNGRVAVVPVRMRRRKRRRVRVVRRMQPVQWVSAPNGGAMFINRPGY